MDNTHYSRQIMLPFFNENRAELKVCHTIDFCILKLNIEFYILKIFNILIIIALQF